MIKQLQGPLDQPGFRELTEPADVLVYLYCWLNREQNTLGVCPMSVRLCAHETRLEPERVAVALKTLERAGLIAFDSVREWVFVRGLLANAWPRARMHWGAKRRGFLQSIWVRSPESTVWNAFEKENDISIASILSDSNRPQEVRSNNKQAIPPRGDRGGAALSSLENTDSDRSRLAAVAALWCAKAKRLLGRRWQPQAQVSRIAKVLDAGFAERDLTAPLWLAADWSEEILRAVKPSRLLAMNPRGESKGFRDYHAEAIERWFEQNGDPCPWPAKPGEPMPPELPHEGPLQDRDAEKRTSVDPTTGDGASVDSRSPRPPLEDFH